MESRRGERWSLSRRGQVAGRPRSVVLLSVAAGPGGEASARDSGPATLSTSDDALQLVRVLQRYKAGYEALDAKAIAAVYPAANVASLQSALNQLSKLSYDVKLHVDGIVIAADGQTASVTASETFRSTPKIGSAPHRRAPRYSRCERRPVPGRSKASSPTSATRCHPERLLWASRLWSLLPAHFCV